MMTSRDRTGLPLLRDCCELKVVIRHPGCSRNGASGEGCHHPRQKCMCHTLAWWSVEFVGMYLSDCDVWPPPSPINSQKKPKNAK